MPVPADLGLSKSWTSDIREHAQNTLPTRAAREVARLVYVGDTAVFIVCTTTATRIPVCPKYVQVAFHRETRSLSEFEIYPHFSPQGGWVRPQYFSI